MTEPIEARLPMISCVVATQGRPGFLAQSIRYFLAQDYPERELIIVYERPSDLPTPCPDDPRIHRRRAIQGASIGSKRNIGVHAARGDIIAQWDDDDWYGPSRLTAQAAPLLDGSADITGLRGVVFFELMTWTFWRASERLHERMFVNDVHGGTLVYQRRVWDQLARYPDISLREDVGLLIAAMRKGARLARIDSDRHYLYVRHGDNTWRFQSGAFLDPNAWQAAVEPAFLGQDRGFYQTRRARARARAIPEPAPLSPSASPSQLPTPSASPSQPPSLAPIRARRAVRVACIMPTYNRASFVARSVQYFLRQDYVNRELIVVDDGTSPVRDLIPDDPRVTYVRLADKTPLGTKRNLACEATSADVIIHWDDDDWMASTWITAQVDTLTRHRADVTGLQRVYFYRPTDRRAWEYRYPSDRGPWVHGATLCYTRALWRDNPFAPVDRGEDIGFLHGADTCELVANAHKRRFVSYIHANNTSPKRLLGSRWRSRPAEIVERLILTDGHN